MNGQKAERTVASQFDLDRFEGDWCDLVNPRTGAKYEVKSADADRQFRLWRDQHRSLVAASARGTAWYVFVVGSTVKRRQPSTVTHVVRDRGGWNKSGHRGGKKQLKVPVDELL